LTTRSMARVPMHLRPCGVQLSESRRLLSRNAVRGRDAHPYGVQRHRSKAHDHRLSVVSESRVLERLIPRRLGEVPGPRRAPFGRRRPATPPLAPDELRPDPCPRDSLGPETHVTRDAVCAWCPVSLGYATDTSPAARRSRRLRQYGGPRAGARRGASVDSPRPRRKRRTDAASVTSATRGMRPPQRGHARTSIAKQRLRSSAQGRYRDPARFAGFSASVVPSAATGGLGTIFGLILLAGARIPA
jgi:hypothetical protein